MRASRPLPSFPALCASLLAALPLVACSGEVDTSAGGTTGSSSSTGSTGGGGAGGGTPVECSGAVPVPAADGTDSGFARCPDGTVHRVKAVACNPETGVMACSGTEAEISCKGDADCTAKPHGRCADHLVSTFGGPMTACDCVYPCTGDADCGAGRVCVCAGVVTADQSFSYCAPASCTTGADCQSGECGISSYDDGCMTEVALACRSPADMCRVDAQCDQNLGQHCVASQFGSPPGTWRCQGVSCMNSKAPSGPSSDMMAPAKQQDRSRRTR